MPDSSKHPAVGIDLGTTFSAVAYLDPTGRPVTIRNSEGDLTTPSAVFFDQSRPIVGVEAVEAGLLEPDRLAQYAKRDVGEQHYEKKIRNLHLPAELIQSLVLRKLKVDAELKLGEISKAVITVPAFFNEPCRKATQDAGRLAGLEVLDIINEPTAAAITYGIEQGFLADDGKTEEKETVLVYDLGGGTFDVTVMEIHKGHFKTIATAGDVYLGGIDWDSRIVDFIAEHFEKEHGVDPRQDPQAQQELLRKANQTKHALTQRESVSVAFAHDRKRLRTELTQKEFADRCVDLVERTIMTVQMVLDAAEINWTDLTRLILVGGSTRMPMVRDELERLSNMTLDRSLSPDEAVSHGAALYAGMLLSGTETGERGISVRNVNSHDLGVLAVDPKTGKPRRQIMIPRNSELPARRTVRFRTHRDNQANVKINVVEGGDDRGINATAIGECIVDDLPKGTPKGTNVDVQFDYAADGRLTIHASLPEIDRKIAMTLDRAAGLSDDEIQQWSTRLDDGLSDEMLASLSSQSQIDEIAAVELPQETVEVAADKEDSADKGEQESEVLFESLDDDEEDSEELPVFADIAKSRSDEQLEMESTAQPIAQPKSRPKPEPKKVASQPVKATASETPKKSKDVNAASKKRLSKKKSTPAVQIDTGQREASPRISAAEAVVVPDTGQPVPTPVSEKPQVQIDSETATHVQKADASDFAQLAMLTGGGEPKPSPSSADVPLIVTDSGPRETQKEAPPKKSKLFGRKK